MIKNSRKYFSPLIKLLILIFAGWFIYTRVNDNQDLKNFIAMVRSFTFGEISGRLLPVVLLMFINWGIESIKWQYLIRKVEKISFRRAVESVFCGLTWAIFTPNRIGEYGGRVFFLSPGRRITGVVAMAVGGAGQIVVTNLCGILALGFFVSRFKISGFVPDVWLLVLALLLISLLLLLFFNIGWLNKWLVSWKVTRRYHRFYAILQRYSRQELALVLLLSLLRYVVFTSQYVLIFNWLIPGLAAADVLMLICVFFFIQSYLPSLDLLDIGIRSVSALFVFGYLTDKSAAVVACIASIWLINLIIPAILGTYFVLKLNFFGNRRTAA